VTLPLGVIHAMGDDTTLPSRGLYQGPARTSLGSVIGFLTIENAFESAKVPFRRSRSVVETGAADFVLRQRVKANGLKLSVRWRVGLGPQAIL
jgi:hypothetical protein